MPVSCSSCIFDFLKKLLNYFLKWIYHFTCSPAIYENSSSSTISTSHGMVRYFNFKKLNRCLMLSHCGFAQRFSKDLRYLALFFHVSICILYFIFAEVSVKIFCTFKKIECVTMNSYVYGIFMDSNMGNYGKCSAIILSSILPSLLQ